METQDWHNMRNIAVDAIIETNVPHFSVSHCRTSKWNTNKKKMITAQNGISFHRHHFITHRQHSNEISHLYSFFGLPFAGFINSYWYLDRIYVSTY